ncbi:hypothetical protein BGZ60DRAFT_410376 [Tricladium varicosporioides]|nr:hypothetical protein BGZ60DRAFT_410376 [Hymenoscyphus varicosporioides]
MSTLTPNPLPLRLAQTLGLTTTAIFSGVSIALSTILVPRILESPAPLLVRQWGNMFARMKIVAPGVMLVSASAFTYASLILPASLTKHKTPYLIIAALNTAMLPYTIIFMSSTNNKLLALEEREKVGELELDKDGEARVAITSETAHSLVDWWGMLNLGRSVLCVAGTIVGVWTVVN